MGCELPKLVDMGSVPSNPNRTFRFGVFELDGVTGELRKEGKTRPRLQGQPLELLLQLLGHAGELVTREELRQRLWPADTFVDYDHSLNAAVNKLREALGDSAESPRFIQTLPRRGYRFIAAVEVMADGAFAPALPNEKGGLSAEPPAPVSIAEETRNFVLSDSQDLPAASHAVVRLLFSLIQAMYLAFYVIGLANLHRVEPLFAQVVERPFWLVTLLLVTALVGIPVRLYLLSAAIFGYRGLRAKFLRLFPILLPLDELWALAPFLLVEAIGIGLALAATAALLYVPFSQRSLLLMRDGKTQRTGQRQG
jgi:cholera toxin transcriptional activator